MINSGREWDWMDNKNKYMKIMFWVGYANPAWDKGDWMSRGMGGSEYCVIKLADYLDNEGWDVTISGDVKTPLRQKIPCTLEIRKSCKNIKG